MSDLLQIITNSEDMVELGESSLFKKQLLRFSEWVHPNDSSKQMTIDKAFAQKLVENFKERVAGRVPVPVEHWRYGTNDSMANAGELVDLSVEEDGVYGTIEVKRSNVAQDIKDGILFDVSASFDENYHDKESDSYLGPVMRHVALVNKPYIKKLNPFIALSESLEAEMGQSVTLLSEKENYMPVIKNDKDYEVEITLTVDGEEEVKTLAPGEELEVAEDQLEAVQKQLDEAEAPEEVEESDEEEEKTDEEADESDEESEEESEDESEDEEESDEEDEEEKEEEESTELSETDRVAQENAKLKQEIRERDIKDSFDSLLKDGYVTPAMKDEFVQLSEQLHDSVVSLSEGEEKSASDILTDMLKKKRIVSLDEESGESNNESTNEDDPVTELSEEQRAALKRMGVSDDDYRESLKGLDLSK